jgi:hypothetical protein
MRKRILKELLFLLTLAALLFWAWFRLRTLC